MDNECSPDILLYQWLAITSELNTTHNGVQFKVCIHIPYPIEL